MDREHAEIISYLEEAAYAVGREKEATGKAEPPEGYKESKSNLTPALTIRNSLKAKGITHTCAIWAEILL